MTGWISDDKETVSEKESAIHRMVGRTEVKPKEIYTPFAWNRAGHDEHGSDTLE